MRHSSVGAAASKADTERVIPSIPAARTQTIEFAPYPLPRHRTSRDKSRNQQPTSDINAKRFTTSALPTGYDTRTPITSLFSVVTNPRSRIYYCCTSISNRIDAHISRCSSSRNAHQFWWLSRPSRDHVPATSSFLSWRPPTTYKYYYDAPHNYHHIDANKY
jgi:hypothetical protein